jgi:hypothetical protein
MVPYRLTEKDSATGLNLMIGTKKECTKSEAKGPDFDKRNKCITWGIWLPYNLITNSINPTETFIDNFFDAAYQVFSTYGVKPENVEKCCDEIKKKVVGNSEYIYSGGDIPPIELSGIKLK